MNFVCERCEDIFASKKSLLNHKRKVINCAEKKAKREKKLEKNKQIKEKKENLSKECPRCHKIFKRYADQRNHVEKVLDCIEKKDKKEKIEKNVEHICDKCGNKFKSHQSLRNHQKRVQNCLEKKIEKEGKILVKDMKKECPRCGTIFKSMQSCKNHIEKFLNCKEEKEKQALFQKYSFINEFGKINYKCDKCETIFGDRSHFEIHLKIYENKSCVGKKKKDNFNENKILDENKQIKYKCEKCDKIFSDKRALKNHIDKVKNCNEIKKEMEKYIDDRVLINGRVNYQCFECEHVFRDLTGYKRHLDRFKNKSCLKEKNLKDELEKNKIIVNGYTRYKCLECGKFCEDRHNLLRHIKGNRDCNPNYKIEEKNGIKVIHKETNRYRITEGGNQNRLCKAINEETGELCIKNAVKTGYCINHGGIVRRQRCQIEDEDGKCNKLAKGKIDTKNGNIYVCIFHGAINSYKPSPEKQKEYNEKYKGKYKYKAEWCVQLLNGCKSADTKKYNDVNEMKNYITIPYIKAKMDICENKCFWCKKSIHTNKGNYDFEQISIDRLDNDEAHVVNNVVISCLFCNRARNYSDQNNWKKYINCLLNNEQPNFEKEEVDTYWASAAVARCKKQDQINNREFNITTEWIKEQYEKCQYSFYTGLPMFPSIQEYFPFQPSIERIDNSRGHTKDNVTLVCLAENFGRNNADFDSFQEWLLGRF